MKRYLYVAAILGAVGLWASCGSSGSEVLFAVSQTTSQVTGYTISGPTLAEIGSPIATGANPVAAVVHPNGNYLYVADSGNAEVSVFSVNGSGGLTLASTNANAGTHPVALAVEPDGNYLFVADSGTTSASALTIFSIDSSSGSLTPIAGSPYPLQFKPTCLLQSPVLSALFAAAQNEVISIPIASGAPEKYIITIPSAAPTATSPTAIVTDSASRFLYVADSGALIYAYTIASDGTIAAVPGSPFAAGGVKPASLAIDPTGSYLFVANQDSNNVTGFAITQSTGALAPISGSPFAAGAQPSSITFDNKSGNLYVANIGASTVSGYSMNSSTGALTSLGTAFPTTPNPIWLTTVDK